MTRLVRSQYISTFCFCNIASLAASAVPGRTTPVVRAFTALPGTLASGWLEERAAANLVFKVLFSFCEVLSESASLLFSAVRAALVFVSAATSLFLVAISDVRAWRSATCCLSALITASWSFIFISRCRWTRVLQTYPLRPAPSASLVVRSLTPS